MDPENEKLILRAGIVLHGSDLIASTIQIACRYIPDNMIRHVFNITIDLFHVCSSFARLMLDAFSRKIENITASCVELLTSAIKLIFSLWELFPNDERVKNYLNKAHLGINIVHCFFSSSHMATRGVQLRYVPTNNDQNNENDNEPPILV